MTLPLIAMATYATESANGAFNYINKLRDSIQLFVQLADASFPNGISYYKPLHVLFVSTCDGIVKINLDNKNMTRLSVAPNVNVDFIDGLTIWDNYFIGHQSSKVSRFFADEEFNHITRSEILDSGPDFDSSTTGEIAEGYYHFIVNSQIRSGVDLDLQEINPMDSLEHVIIRRIRLSRECRGQRQTQYQWQPQPQTSNLQPYKL